MASWPDCLLDPGIVLRWTHGVLSRVWASFGFEGRVIDDHVIWMVADGGCEVRGAEAALSMRRGALMWMPPGERHSVSILPTVRPMLAYSCRFSLHDGQSVVRFPHAAILRQDARESEPDLRRLVEDINRTDAWSPMRARASLHLLYTTLMRPNAQGDGSARLSTAEQVRLARYVRMHLARRIGPADLARELGLGPVRFARLFKAAYGIAPRRWLVETRISEACFRLGHSHEPIGAIADALGYADRHLFNRQFRAVVGRTPRAYRQRSYGPGRPEV